MLEKSKLKSLLLRNSLVLGTFGTLNKSEGGGGRGGPGRRWRIWRKKVINVSYVTKFIFFTELV